MTHLTSSEQPCPKCLATMRCYVDDEGDLLSEWCPQCHYTEKESNDNGKGPGQSGRDSSSKGA